MQHVSILASQYVFLFKSSKLSGEQVQEGQWNVNNFKPVPLEMIILMCWSELD